MCCVVMQLQWPIHPLLRSSSSTETYSPQYPTRHRLFLGSGCPSGNGDASARPLRSTGRTRHIITLYSIQCDISKRYPRTMKLVTGVTIGQHKTVHLWTIRILWNPCFGGYEATFIKPDYVSTNESALQISWPSSSSLDSILLQGTR